MIDYAFLVAISVFALCTPIKSTFGHINIVLAAKFAIIIGIYEVMLDAGMMGGVGENIIMASLELMAAYAFYKFKGFYLSFVCVAIAIFQIADIFYIYDFKTIMICFQVLQLMAASWGAIDGLSAYLSWPRLNHRSHQR